MERNRNDFEELSSKHRKKMVAPIVITGIFVLYYCFFAVMCFVMPMPVGIKLLMGIIPLALAGVIIYVLIERIDEIRSGEEDDLSKY